MILGDYMKSIWKYDIPLQDKFTLDIPENFTVLTVQVQHGVGRLWAEVYPENPMKTATLYVFGTGHPLPYEFTGWHIGTFVAGSFVWHVYHEPVK
jgi:hypothetical protein